MVTETSQGTPARDDVVQSIAGVFKLLGDPTRVRMLDALTQEERCVCDLAALVGSTESAVSHQLRLLRAARLVRVRRSGRHAFYSLDDHHVAGLLRDVRKHVEEDHDVRKHVEEDHDVRKHVEGDHDVRKHVADGQS